WVSVSFFFFQAEDGIRDFHVTGVQTCALPICGGDDLRMIGQAKVVVGAEVEHRTAVGQRDLGRLRAGDDPFGLEQARVADLVERSEERRVGKECRSGWWGDHEKGTAESMV